MIDSVALTRKGYIKHLATIQTMSNLVWGIFMDVRTAYGKAPCEEEREKKISNSFLKLQELIWETGAVSERIDRERGENNGPEALPRDAFNERDESCRKNLHGRARELEGLARSIWDKGAPEVVTPEVIYPGRVEPTSEEDNPKQLRLELKASQAGGDAPAPQDEPRDTLVDLSRIDYKKEAANDDTNKPEES